MGKCFSQAFGSIEGLTEISLAALGDGHEADAGVSRIGFSLDQSNLFHRSEDSGDAGSSQPHFFGKVAASHHFFRRPVNVEQYNKLIHSEAIESTVEATRVFGDDLCEGDEELKGRGDGLHICLINS